MDISPQAFPALPPDKPMPKSPFRTLAQVADATPKDYLLQIPPNPEQIALQMIRKAEALFPIKTGLGIVAATNYSFLFIGPGSGLVIQALLDLGHMAQALETSRRAISLAPELVRNYINWSKPWELPYASKQGPTASQPLKLFHVGLISKYYQKILTPVEWSESVKEIKKVCRYAAVI